jgi:nucleotide-binding universal stress UspA family protein
MKIIIIPTDFSSAASNALKYGVKLANEVDAGIILFHAYQVPLYATEVSVVVAETSIAEMRRHAEDALSMIRENIQKDNPEMTKIYTEVRMGDTVSELEKLSNEIKPFAVVMSSTGHSPLGRVLFGSTTLATIRHLNFPVIAVPMGTEYKTIKKIGLASDLNHVSESMPVSFIREITSALHAELHILNVDHRHPKYDPDKNEQLYEVQTLLKDMKPVFHFVDHVDIEEGINQFARENQLDLVLTIPKKHNLFDSVFHKSGSKQILFGSQIPVMSIHEPS